MPTRAYAAKSATAPLAPHAIERRALGPKDVRIAIKYCGVCHSDLHQARNEWGNTIYPSVPGHEIVGHVTAVGGEVRSFKEGDFVGVGCLVDSCGTCTSCKAGLEQYCTTGWTGTYNAADKHMGGTTFGGYSDSIVVTEHFVLRIPKHLDATAVAPLLCAGITTYSPLRHFGVKKGQKVGVVGLGGLGHMGVKIGAAMGAEVVLITTSPKKAEDAKRLGAKDVLVSTEPTQLAKHQSSFDFIIDTVSADHDINALLDLLRLDGTLVLVGAPEKPLPVHPFSVIMSRRRLAGSLIGGIAETQEMLDFCGEHGIVSDVELIPIQQINDAYERMLKGDVRYRFVIDSASLRAS
jgi:uncharacterized zinc-type alcohol dehydrogenase-like protein